MVDIKSERIDFSININFIQLQCRRENVQYIAPFYNDINYKGRFNLYMITQRSENPNGISG